MFILKLLPFLNYTIKKIMGKNKAQFFLDLVSNKERFYSIDKIYDFDKKSSVNRLTLLLPGKGCAWARKTGGCTMCGFPQKIEQIGKKFTAKDLLSLYKVSELMTLEENPYLLTIYNAGSFINDIEIPSKTQEEICQKVRKHHSIRKLFIESRAEFVTADKIRFLKNKLREKELVVAIGLESQNDKIRNIYIRKGLTKKTYEKAVKTIKENGAKALTYVFIKPIYLTEREAIDDAIATTKYAFNSGTDEVAFESAFVQEGTLMELLYRAGKFRPPWLWSIIKVIKKTYSLGPIHLGKFDDEPPPIAIPSNCPKCSKRIKESLQIFRETNNIKVLNNLNCTCREKWQRIVKL